MGLFKHRTLPVTRRFQVDVDVRGRGNRTGARSLRIAHLSDIHDLFHQIPGGAPALLDAVGSTEPDLIALTGDLFDKRAATAGLALQLLHDLAAVAPVYLVAGNHDKNPMGDDGRQLSYTAVRELGSTRPQALSDMPSLLALHADELRDGPALLLEDQVLAAPADGDEGGRVLLCGLRDPWPLSAADPAKVRLRMAEVLGAARRRADYEGRPLVVLAHRPEFARLYASCGADLVLSGHTHGGQVRMPLIGALSVPNQRRPFYDRGLFFLGRPDNGKTALIVSAGLGTSARSPRINCPPEIGLVRLSWTGSSQG